MIKKILNLFTVFTTTFVFVSLFLAGTAFGTTTVTGITAIGVQSVAVTYGTVTSPTYLVTLGTSGSGSGSATITAVSGIPAGVSFTPTGTFNPNSGTVTLTLTTSTSSPAGSFSFTVTVKDNNSGLSHPSVVTGTLLISPKVLTITGLVTGSKTYDGTTTAGLGGTPALNGVLAADVSNVTLGGTGTAAFATSSVGVGKTVTVSGFTISGTAAGNYTLTQPTLTANITVLTISITGLTANNKVYDGGTTATTSGGSLVGVIGSDVVTFTGSGIFATSPVGVGISVSSTTTLGGAQAGNYTLAQPVGLTANITAKTLTLSPAAVTSKAYDGTNTATITGTFVGVVGADVVTLVGTGTYASVNVGAGIAVTASCTLTGTNSGNYTLTQPIGLTGNITTATLTITANDVSKTLGATLSTVTGSTAFTTSGIIGSETVGTVTITYGTGSASGAPVGNYTGQVTPSAAVGGTFSPGNYTIVYVSGTLTVTTTFVWTGVVSSDWATPGNWTVGGVQQTTYYPGSSFTTDAPQIGVSAFTNQPTISATLPNAISTIIFGGSSTINLTLAASVVLTVNDLFSLNAGSETVNLIAPSSASFILPGDYSTGAGSTFNNGSESMTVAGNFTNAGTINLGTGLLTIEGGFANTGTCNFGTGLLTFNNLANGTPTYSTTTPLIFNNVLFTDGNGSKVSKITATGSGSFSLASTGTLTLAGTAHLNLAGNGLTLLSDANSTATIATIPAGCKITGGAMTVQRYLSGHRGYRLLSPPISTAGNINVSYVKNSAWLTGTTGAAGGFDKTGSPTLYIYRENLAVSNATFTSGNYRGINNITAGTSYTLDIDGGPYTIPIGNGFLFFFRGNKADGTLAQETVAAWPATTATLSITGAVNNGQITFTHWYNGAANLLFTNTAGNSTVQGFNLAGNPYPSSLDLDTYNTSSSTTGIYAPNTSSFIYELNPVTQNYDVYQAGSGGAIFTNNGSRTIESGQGFFMLAINASAQLIFNESAKSSSQNTGSHLFMGTPVAVNTQYLRLQMAKDSIIKDDILLNFKSGAAAQYDKTADAPYKQGNGVLGLYGLSADSVAVAIKTLALPKTSQTIRLNVSATANGIYKLNLASVKSIPALFDIWLMDAFNKDSLDIRHNLTYSFNINRSDATTYGPNRFSLVIRQNPALGVHLLDFTAAKATAGAQITWKTENEENYTNFTVERSTDDGKTFDVVGGLSSSAQGTYSLTDKYPVTGTDQYRLKLEDLNGAITYSKVVSLMYSNLSNNLTKSTINIYPNPATSTLNLAITKSVNSGSYDIQIVNNLGSVIKTASSSQTSWQTDISQFMPGSYIIRVVNNNDKSVVGKGSFIKL